MYISFCVTPQITSLTESSLFFFQGRVSVADIIGFSGSETISSKPEGSVVRYVNSSVEPSSDNRLSNWKNIISFLFLQDH